MEDRGYKYTDKNHPPVPMLKVGDRCYTHCAWNYHNYEHISVCEVRKVEVRWYEPTKYEKEQGEYGYWHIDYYIRTDVNNVALKSTRMYAYHTGEDGFAIKDLYFTPQEVLESNIRDFGRELFSRVTALQNTMRKLGYSQEDMKRAFEDAGLETRKLLESHAK